MPDFLDLIKEKNRRLESIPEKFLSQVRKSERQVYEIVIQLLGQLEQRGGKFVASIENVRIAGQINAELKKALYGSDYVKAVSEFASEFDIQNDLNFSYFKDVFELKKSSELAAAITLQNKSNAIDLLLNRGADTDFVAPLRGIIENSVITNASYKDTLFAIREFVEGNENFDSRLVSYSRQIAHDTFAIADRVVTSTYADEVDADWFLYLGDVITTSRAFCKERHGNYYHWKEIAAWGAGKKTQGLMLPDSDGHWQGEIDGTNKDTIFIYAGGYNCRHAINAVSVAVVPKVVLQRNIEQGFYNPSEKEKEILGL